MTDKPTQDHMEAAKLTNLEMCCDEAGAVMILAKAFQQRERHAVNAALADNRDTKLDLIEALERQTDNLEFFVNHVTMPEPYRTKIKQAFTEGRAALNKAKAKA